jgi:hypothetical protein
LARFETVKMLMNQENSRTLSPVGARFANKSLSA